MKKIPGEIVITRMKLDRYAAVPSQKRIVFLGEDLLTPF
jgi:hypothetical protein